MPPKPGKRHNHRRDVAERFWEKVARRGPDECWEWQASVTGSQGYGQFIWDYKMIPAHRAAFMLVKGTIPDGLIVRHGCDNPVCCNPAHLEMGTHKQNTADMDQRGRRADRKGERHPRSRITAEQVVKIRKLHELDVMTMKQIGALFGITRQNVGLIVNGNAWQHVKQ